MIWGSTFVVQKTAFIDDGSGADLLGALTFTGARFLLGALVVLPLALREFSRSSEPLRTTDLVGFGLCGAALFAGSYTQQLGIIQTSVTNAGFFTALYVPMVPFLALFLFRRRPHWAVWPAAGVCVAGTYLMNGGTLTRFATGDLWVLSGAIFWASHVTLVGLFATRSGLPLTLAFVQFMVVGVLSSAGAIGYEQPGFAVLSGAAFEILWAGAMSVGIAFTMQVVGQRHTHPADAAIILSSETLFAALAGAIVLGERMGPLQLIGGVLILSSIVLVEFLPLLRRPKVSAAA